jgi:RHS repeat-associated protein
LIGEYAPDGKLLTETVWFNGMPIASLRPKGSNGGTPLGIGGTTTGNPSNGATAANANNVGTNTTTNRVNVEVFYIHPDHLGTPRVITRSTIATGANAPSSSTGASPGAINKSVWRHDSDPFGTSLGNSQPTENPQLISGTQTIVQAGSFKQNLRFPGQLADGESGKHQNWNRDYDSAIGRYSTSDPIGLDGGITTYGYADLRPTRVIDPTGEAGNEGDGSAGGRGTNQPYKHCREFNPPQRKFINCKDKKTGKWIRVHRPDSWPFPEPPPEPPKKEMCGDDCPQKVATVVMVGGGAYLIYRCVRMIPSLAPPLWWTIPGNIAAP